MSLFLQKMFPAKPANKPMTVAPTTNFKPFSSQSGHNPFMVAMQGDSKAFESSYGKNQPLAKPMFLGYDNDRALYGGSKLFVLY